MPTPQTPYDAVLHAGRDIAKVDSALDAEMLGAALLGSVYAIAETDRASAVRDFVGGFLDHTARRRTAAARVLRAVFAALVPDAAGAARVTAAARGTDALPAWLGHLGKARLTDSCAYGDAYGDQTSYLAVFDYPDPDLGGPPHAVVILVDHNIGIVKDVFVGYPAERVLAEVHKAAETDELVWLEPVEPAAVRAGVAPYLEITDGLSELPDGGSLATDLALVTARLAVLPAPAPAPPPATPADPAQLVPAFLDSPHASELDRSTEDTKAALDFSIQLILDFARDAPDADPLRWSPAVVGLFLLDWVHRRAVLDEHDVAMLPRVVRAWAAWAAQRRGTPPAAAMSTDAAIETMTPEFVRLHGTGERRTAAARAMAQLLADGVDPANADAIDAWLRSQPVPPDPGAQPNGHRPH